VSKWTEQELEGLESIVEEDILYLVVRKGEDLQKVFRLRYPSHEQRLKAEAIRQSYYWQLRKQEGLKTREEVEAEFADELKDLRSEVSTLRADHKKASVEYIELLGQIDEMPDPDVDREGFNDRAMEIGSKVDELLGKIKELGQRINAILSNSIEYLSRQRYVAVLAALCWEEQSDGKWKPIWGDFEKFRNDRSPLATTLEVEAAVMLLPGAGFFVSSPSRPSGGSVISAQSQESETSSQGQ